MGLILSSPAARRLQSGLAGRRLRSMAVARRRWTLTGALLLLTLIGTVIALGAVPRTYQSQSSVVLLASRSVSRLNGGNPYLSFSPSLTLAADVVTRELMAPGSVRYLASRGFTDSYTVALAPYTTSTTGSVLLISVTGTDQAGVQRTLRGVTADIRTRLARLQSSVSRENRIQTVTLAMTRNASLSVSQTARPFAVLIGLGLMLAFGVPWLLDARNAARRLRPEAGPGLTVPHPADPVAVDHWAHIPDAAQADPSRAGSGHWAGHPAHSRQISE